MIVYVVAAGGENAGGEWARVDAVLTDKVEAQKLANERDAIVFERTIGEVMPKE